MCISLQRHDVKPSCIDLSTDTLNLPHHNVTIVESELFDPALDVFVGDNDDDEDDHEKQDDSDDKPRKKVDVGLVGSSVFDAVLIDTNSFAKTWVLQPDLLFFNYYLHDITLIVLLPRFLYHWYVSFMVSHSSSC